MGEPYYITTAISYPNGKPHIGHAYEAIAADASSTEKQAAADKERLEREADAAEKQAAQLRSQTEK